MASQSTQPAPADWLLEHGPRELELLFRAIVYHPSVPILIADDDRNYRDASAGAARLLGLPRTRIIGQRIDDFAASPFKPVLSTLWSAFLGRGEQHGTLPLTGADGTLRDVEYTAKGSVLPVRHLLILRAKATATEEQRPGESKTPSWVQDYALFLLDVNGEIVNWYLGAVRIYGYSVAEACGQHVSLLYPHEENSGPEAHQELNRSAAEGHFGNESWQVRKDGSRFWANVITLALRDANAELQGFARIVRDFTERHERDEELRRSRTRSCPLNRPSQASSRASSTRSGRLMMRSWTCWATAAKTCQLAGCTGPISRRRNTLFSMIWHMRKACSSAPARRMKKSWPAKMVPGFRFSWRPR